ncbi:MAG: hypothetical protein ACKOQS_07380 [Dolichospermum sp.]
MLSTIAKRIQSRLSRQGVKVSLAEIKEQCDRLISDIDNATETDILNVTEYFINNATKLTVVSEDVSSNLYANEAAQMELETLISEDVSSNLYANEAALDTEQETALATATKSELVASTAGSLGIVLDAQEISLIAENISYSTDTLEQDIDAIESAIMAFVEHKAAISQQKINNMITSVRNVVTEKNSENSQLLTDGLRSINSDIQEANKQFKSNVQKCLTAFAIPIIKAG